MIGDSLTRSLGDKVHELSVYTGLREVTCHVFSGVVVPPFRSPRLSFVTRSDFETQSQLIDHAFVT